MILHSSSTFSPQPTKDYFIFFFSSPLLKQQLTGFSTNGSRCKFALSHCAPAKRRGQVLQRDKALSRRTEERPESEKLVKNTATMSLIKMVTATSQCIRRLRLQDGAGFGHWARPHNLPSSMGSTGQQ